jgi:hypothetical protein
LILNPNSPRIFCSHRDKKNATKFNSTKNAKCPNTTTESVGLILLENWGKPSCNKIQFSMCSTIMAPLLQAKTVHPDQGQHATKFNTTKCLMNFVASWSVRVTLVHYWQYLHWWFFFGVTLMCYEILRLQQTVFRTIFTPIIVEVSNSISRSKTLKIKRELYLKFILHGCMADHVFWGVRVR